MGKICYINGQPFMVTIPTGGKSENDRLNQWNKLINFLGEESNDIFHWKGICSWCQERVLASTHAICGYHSARYWNWIDSSSRCAYLGFRPVLTPLNADTLKPDPSLLKDIPNGRVFALASLYMNGKVVKNPEIPIDDGDIPNYLTGTKITLGNRDPDKKNWLYVIKYKDLLWTDRNILKNISWDDLKQQGFTSEE